jgi:hypothetical protein
MAHAVGAWSGRVVGAPTTPVAQSNGTSSSGSGSGGGSSGSGPTSTTTPRGSTTTADTTAAPATTGPDVPEDRIAEAKPEDDAKDCAAGARCYQDEQAAGVEAVRVPDGKGGTVVVALGDAPVVNVDSGASTSASSNVDLRVDVDVNTGAVIRVERRVDPVRQFVLITIAALLGVFVGAAVLGTFLRFRNGPRPR